MSIVQLFFYLLLNGFQFFELLFLVFDFLFRVLKR